MGRNYRIGRITLSCGGLEITRRQVGEFIPLPYNLFALSNITQGIRGAEGEVQGGLGEALSSLHLKMCDNNKGKVDSRAALKC